MKNNLNKDKEISNTKKKRRMIFKIIINIIINNENDIK